MKKLLKVIIIILFSQILTIKSFAGVGRGDLKLTPGIVEYFIEYIRGKHSKSPEIFIVSDDSSWATFYYCPVGPGNCSATGNDGIRYCEDKTGTKCGLFARGRSIKWKNGTNPGKGKVSKIKSKWSDAEIIAKLTELGFIDDETNNAEEETSSNEASKEKLDQLESLTQLYKEGHLNKEEFEKAKKLILDSN